MAPEKVEREAENHILIRLKVEGPRAVRRAVRRAEVRVGVKAVRVEAKLINRDSLLLLRIMD